MKVNQAAGTESMLVNKNQNQTGQKDAEKVQKPQGKQDGTVKVEHGSINAVGLNLFDDEIENKKKKAAGDAMDFLKKQFEADGAIDKTVETCQERTDESKAILKEAGEELDRIREEKGKLKEMYGGDVENAEYKERVAGYNQSEESWHKQQEAALSDIQNQSANIRNIRQEVLKYHGMTDAVKAADETMKAVNKEITGMMLEEAKDTVDKKVEDAVEKGKEEKEESAEKKADIEERKAEMEENQAKQTKKAEDNEEVSKKSHDRVKQKSSGGASFLLPEMEQRMNEVRQNTEQILQEQKLLEEDIKGIAVDSIL